MPSATNNARATSNKIFFMLRLKRCRQPPQLEIQKTPSKYGILPRRFHCFPRAAATQTTVGHDTPCARASVEIINFSPQRHRDAEIRNKGVRLCLKDQPQQLEIAAAHRAA